MATHHLSLVEADPNADEQVKDMNAFILSAANGDWPEAERRAKRLTEREPENIVVSIFRAL